MSNEELKKNIEELKKNIEELTYQITELKNWKVSLEASHSIPLNIHQSFSARFANLNITSSNHTGDRQTVNESGAGNYDVMKPADSFGQITLGLTTFYIPLFTS